MGTARDRITRMMRLIGAIAQGQTPSAPEIADGITAMNGMFGQWSADGFVIPNAVREEFSLVSGTASYTMGPSATFNTSRPTNIVRATIEIQDANPYETAPVDIITVEDYADISNKATAGTPTKLYVEHTATQITLYLWPVPDAANKIALYSEKPLTLITDASDNVTLPPGYDDLIDFNGAVRLAPEYGKAVSAEVASIAQSTLETIQRKNLKPQTLSVDAALLGGKRYNIYTGP